MFIPGLYEFLLMFFEYPRYLADIVGSESAAPGERNGIEPEFRFIPGFGNMYVYRFVRLA